MPSQPASRRNRFLGDDRGTVALLFAFSVIPVLLIVGLAVDGARGYYTSTKLLAVLDSAALATAKSMRDRDLTDAEVRAIAELYVGQHMAHEAPGGITTSTLGVSIDRVRNSITLDLTAHVANHFGQLMNVPRFEVVRSTTALYGSKEIELGLMLDVSGSMNDDGKIDDLKAAVHSLLDIMMPGTEGTAKVRIGIAPYATSVNAGSFASRVKDGGGDPSIKCVSERRGGSAFLDDEPAGANRLGSRAVACPASEIVPLTDRKHDLQAKVDALAADGRTAGHLGIGWAWYLVSPSWSSIWPAPSQPKGYGDTRALKSVVLMTDGMFNTAYEAANGTSARQAEALCANIKSRGVLVYTIGFQAPPEVLPLLRGCASMPRHFFDARDSAALSAAFAKIAADLTDLRLTR